MQFLYPRQFDYPDKLGTVTIPGKLFDDLSRCGLWVDNKGNKQLVWLALSSDTPTKNKITIADH